MNYFYVLRSEKDGYLYYGSTKDLQLRVKRHNDGFVQSTKSHRPLTLLYYEAYLTYDQALDREKMVKRSGTARDTIRKRIGV